MNKASEHKPHTKWTEAEMREFIGMWIAGKEIDEIAQHFNVSRHAINVMATRMRREGVPLPRRKKGHRAERQNKPWTQEEVEYLVRRRNEKVSCEVIGVELGRSFLAVQAMVRKLKSEGVDVGEFGKGARRLWSPEKLNMAIAGRKLRLVG